MTKQDLTAIGLVIDRSGSMTTIRADAEGGINTFLDDQRKEPGEAFVWLAQFDTEYDLLERMTSVGSVKPYRLVPRGGTALYRAMGRLITEMGEDLANTPEDERPGKVLFVIMTDGHENSSHMVDDGVWTYEKLQELVKRQQDEWNWEFIYLSSEPDSVAEAIRMGVPQANTVVLGKSGAQYGMATAAVSSTVSNFRSSGKVYVEDNDLRDKA
jgi:uncharacterized protein YegL